MLSSAGFKLSHETDAMRSGGGGGGRGGGGGGGDGGSGDHGKRLVRTEEALVALAAGMEQMQARQEVILKTMKEILKAGRGPSVLERALMRATPPPSRRLPRHPSACPCSSSQSAPRHLSTLSRLHPSHLGYAGGPR